MLAACIAPLGAHAVLEAEVGPEMPTPASPLPCTTYLAFLKHAGLSLLPCCCSLSSHSPQPCFKHRFKNHLLHAVFHELQWNHEYCLLWTCNPPNLSSAHPFQRVGYKKICPPKSSRFPKLPEIWISCSQPDRHGHCHGALDLYSGGGRISISPADHFAVWSWANYTISLSLNFPNQYTDRTIPPLSS